MRGCRPWVVVSVPMAEGPSGRSTNSNDASTALVLQEPSANHVGKTSRKQLTYY
jgi:hypothetical protein